MRALALLFGLIGVIAAVWPRGRAEAWTVLVTGDVDGYLSPCGCTEPMIGGIRRKGTLLRELGPEGRTVRLDNGSFALDTGPQSRMKAEAMADALRSWAVDAVNLAPAERRWDPGQREALDALLEERFASLARPREAGPFQVAGVTADEDASAFVAQARAAGRVPVLLLSGGRAEAEATARKYPDVRLVVYRQAGQPDDRAVRVGETTLVSPGEKGKYVVSLGWDGRAFTSYRAVSLSPQVKDDPVTVGIYRRYLARVDRAGLLDRVPRTPSAAFAGTPKCGECHAEAHEVWKGSEHAHALKTLEDDGHGRDPDCVGCHVVGLEREGGFISRPKTPFLTDVGCESCHGPGLAHSVAPATARMPKAGQESCLPCHTPQNSPNFNFKTYWDRIRHNLGKTGG